MQAALILFAEQVVEPHEVLAREQWRQHQAVRSLRRGVDLVVVRATRERRGLLDEVLHPWR